VIAGTKRLPVYEEINGVYYVATRQLAYAFQEGIPEYDSATEYFVNSIVKKASTYELYGSKVNNNLGNALPSAVSDSNWEYLGNLSGLGNTTPLGTVLDYAGTTAPTNYLLCYGQAISRTTYAALFALLGTTYGAGDGSTTFNIPDLRGRVVAGQDDMGGTSANRLTGLAGGVDGDVLGAGGGAETHTLVTAEIPAHTHQTGFSNTAGGGATIQAIQNYAGTDGNATSSSVGGDGAHNNVQPTFILNKIIRAL